ncbi:MAG: YcaQ family DNA glycosylase [Armatimonadetes bacterium]|nr:YcaQ family DNA glycosylase [Armatimonadota bacterium]
METISLPQLRRYVIGCQGFASRFRKARPSEVADTVRRLSCVQLDSISAVARSHRLVLLSRAGAYPTGTASSLLGSHLFEYWAHEACLVPVEDYPLFRFRMAERRSHHWFGPVIDSDPALAERVKQEVRDRGPLASRHLEGRGGGGMWNWKPAKRMLDALWTAGELAIAGRKGFERLYDLPERVLPAWVLEAPVPDEQEFLRALAARAVRARGALTEAGIREHYRLKGGAARLRPALEGLESLRLIAVEDGGPPVYVPVEASLAANTVPAGVLLSPFDNLFWDRAFVERVFGFRHRIEVYKPEPERVYGYYVMPFLYRDRLVGRADLKADRPAGLLRVKEFHLESGVRSSRGLAAAFDSAVERLARGLGLEEVARPAHVQKSVPVDVADQYRRLGPGREHPGRC